ncbi:MAG: hypothetical protein RLZZ162_1143, partial [Verrucomicrobiota bacterium]
MSRARSRPRALALADLSGDGP